MCDVICYQIYNWIWSTEKNCPCIQSFFFFLILDHVFGIFVCLQVPIKSIDGDLYVRISAHIYNELLEYAALADAVLALTAERVLHTDWRRRRRHRQTLRFLVPNADEIFCQNCCCQSLFGSSVTEILDASWTWPLVGQLSPKHLRVTIHSSPDNNWRFGLCVLLTGNKKEWCCLLLFWQEIYFYSFILDKLIHLHVQVVLFVKTRIIQVHNDQCGSHSP